MTLTDTEKQLVIWLLVSELEALDAHTGEDWARSEYAICEALLNKLAED